MGEAKRRKIAGNTDLKPKKMMSTEERKKIIKQSVGATMSDMMFMYKDLIRR
jgi:hypothetical protein